MHRWPRLAPRCILAFVASPLLEIIEVRPCFQSDVADEEDVVFGVMRYSDLLPYYGPQAHAMVLIEVFSYPRPVTDPPRNTQCLEAIPTRPGLCGHGLRGYAVTTDPYPGPPHVREANDTCHSVIGRRRTT